MKFVNDQDNEVYVKCNEELYDLMMKYDPSIMINCMIKALAYIIVRNPNNEKKILEEFFKLMVDYVKLLKELEQEDA